MSYPRGWIRVRFPVNVTPPWFDGATTSRGLASPCWFDRSVEEVGRGDDGVEAAGWHPAGRARSRSGPGGAAGRRVVVGAVRRDRAAGCGREDVAGAPGRRGGDLAARGVPVGGGAGGVGERHERRPGTAGGGDGPAPGGWFEDGVCVADGAAVTGPGARGHQRGRGGTRGRGCAARVRAERRAGRARAAQRPGAGRGAQRGGTRGAPPAAASAALPPVLDRSRRRGAGRVERAARRRRTDPGGGPGRAGAHLP